MGSKFSILPSIRDHYGTLVDARSGAPRWIDFVVTLGLPGALGVVTVVLGVRLTGTANLVAGLAILTAFLFGLVVFVFQLRLQMSDRPLVAGATISLVDQLFSNASYAILIGFAALAAVLVGDEVSSEIDGLHPVWSGVVVGLAVHLLLVLAMCLKRLQAAFRQMK